MFENVLAILLAIVVLMAVFTRADVKRIWSAIKAINKTNEYVQETFEYHERIKKNIEEILTKQNQRLLSLEHKVNNFEGNLDDLQNQRLISNLSEIENLRNRETERENKIIEMEAVQVLLNTRIKIMEDKIKKSAVPKGSKARYYMEAAAMIEKAAANA